MTPFTFDATVASAADRRQRLLDDACRHRLLRAGRRHRAHALARGEPVSIRLLLATVDLRALRSHS
jgi:hypothetical protein